MTENSQMEIKGRKFLTTMLGPSGVGKTTLLATMYNQLINIHASNFKFKAEGDTPANLHDAYQMLARYNSQEQKTNVPIKSLLKGTQSLVKHDFSITFEKNPLVHLEFFDHKGGFLHAPKEDPEFLKMIKDCSAFMHVIEGGVLMEGDQFSNNYYNQPMLCRDLLSGAFDDKQEHLVLFIVTKCEKWFKSNGDGYKLLQEKFERHFKPVLNILDKNAVGVFIPVRTLGCVEFTEMCKQEEKNHGDPAYIPVYSKKPGKIAHEYVEQPLKYMLSFILSQEEKQRNFFKKTYWALIGKNKRYRESLREFVNSNKEQFTTYGNKELLNY